MLLNYVTSTSLLAVVMSQKSDQSTPRRGLDHALFGLDHVLFGTVWPRRGLILGLTYDHSSSQFPKASRSLRPLSMRTGSTQDPSLTGPILYDNRMRPPGKSSLPFDHILIRLHLIRLQGELQKSRETDAELHSLNGSIHEIHDTLGGTMVSHLVVSQQRSRRLTRLSSQQIYPHTPKPSPRLCRLNLLLSHQHSRLWMPTSGTTNPTESPVSSPEENLIDSVSTWQFLRS